MVVDPTVCVAFGSVSIICLGIESAVYVVCLYVCLVGVSDVCERVCFYK